jgi:hypothetical protein
VEECPTEVYLPKQEIISPAFLSAERYKKRLQAIPPPREQTDEEFEEFLKSIYPKRRRKRMDKGK